MSARRWVTVAQAAVLTGRSERTIRRWVTAERLRYLDLNGTRFVDEQALLQLERETRRAATGGRPGARPPSSALG